MSTRVFEVTWIQNISANTHEEAAEVAWDNMAYNDPSAAVLFVNDGVETRRVDLTED